MGFYKSYFNWYLCKQDQLPYVQIFDRFLSNFFKSLAKFTCHCWSKFSRIFVGPSTGGTARHQALALGADGHQQALGADGHQERRFPWGSSRQQEPVRTTGHWQAPLGPYFQAFFCNSKHFSVNTFPTSSTVYFGGLFFHFIKRIARSLFGSSGIASDHVSLCKA